MKVETIEVSKICWHGGRMGDITMEMIEGSDIFWHEGRWDTRLLKRQKIIDLLAWGKDRTHDYADNRSFRDLLA
jgi:hypothetical protein